MKKVVYYLFFATNWVITLLPLSVLYLASDLLFYAMFYVLKYRRKVVHENLTNAFPEKSIREILQIEKKFYSHLADLFVETLKMTHLPTKALKKRYIVENPELLDSFADKNIDVIGMAGHYNNWEWSCVLASYTRLILITVYKPLSNKYFDKFMKDNRAKYGSVMTPMSSIVRELVKFRSERIPVIAGLAGDQTPAKKDINHWTTFLNQDTPVFTGGEKLAAKFGMAVVFLNVQKVKRGYYNMKIETLFENCKGMSEGAITEAHVKRLEEIISEKPEYWLWSHKRWKHKRPLVSV